MSKVLIQLSKITRYNRMPWAQLAEKCPGFRPGNCESLAEMDDRQSGPRPAGSVGVALVQTRAP